MEFAFISVADSHTCDLRVITHTNPVHALLYLIISLLAISGVFFSLGLTSPVRWKLSSTRVPLWCCSCSW
ncbi:NADH-quinone oxidoreductase chain J [Escherichia coli]|uniref:NADH-quinone oxidoreductase chain J n=1 Tax=Escherichia coli TaxID=562 RepID=A0A377CA02_ECOLX|nr:NADH-quinone oxidoreductase chain J [Escherichia coli]